MQTVCMKGDPHMFFAKAPGRFLLLLLSFLTAAVWSAGCMAPPEQSDDKLVIAVSIPPQKAFVTAICQDQAQVVTVILPGYSPANYEPDAREMQQLSEADVYFSIGVAAEEAYILPRLGSVPVVDLAERVARELPDRRFASGSRDPHIWLSVARVRIMAGAILEAVVELDPDKADFYTANARIFLEELDQLEQDIHALLADDAGQTIVVYHPSYGYLADEAGLRMLSLEEEGKEATPQHLQNLIDQAREASVGVIFCQAEIDSRQSAAFAEEIGVRIQILDPLSEDYVANMRAIARAFADAS